VNRKIKITTLISENFVWIISILLWIVAGVVNTTFFNYYNLINLLVHSVVLGLLVLGESLCFITGHFDLTIESTLIFTALFAAWLISPDPLASGWLVNPVLAIVLMLVVGTLIGMINGSLVAYLKMNPFITTLAISIVLVGISIFWCKGKSIYPLPDLFNWLGKKEIHSLPVSVIFLILTYIFFHVILTHTPFGRKLYAVGCNIDAARASGINVQLVIFFAYTLSGLLAAFSGWILAGRLNSASSHISTGLLLYVFAAAVIGGVSLSGGKGKSLGAFGGVLLLSSVNNLMNLSHVNAYLIQATTGMIILIAMFIDTMKERLLQSS